MFLDIIGNLLTIIIISPRYWFIVLAVSASELIFSLLLTTAMSLKVTEVIAGGIFSSIKWNSTGAEFLYLASPFFLFFIGIGLLNNYKISWLDVINPLSDFKRPWPVIMIKMAIFRLIIFILFLYKSELL